MYNVAHLSNNSCKSKLPSISKRWWTNYFFNRQFDIKKVAKQQHNLIV